MQVDGAGELVLRVLQLVSVADQGNGGQALQGEWYLLLAFIPGEKMGNHLGIFSDGSHRAIVFL